MEWLEVVDTGVPEGFTVFPNLAAMKRHDEKVDFGDAERFRRELKSKQDDPDVAVFIAEHGEEFGLGGDEEFE